jgi:diguanylate cyclase (GGDEF)-like protein/PAS domain S-box-containing protein
MTDADPRKNAPLVLVVDDDPSFRLLTTASLTKSGFRAAEADDGSSGVAAFERLRPDLVLMDVMMQEMDGFAACASIRKIPGGEHVPVVMMTGLDDTASIHRAYEAGATDFITKPINWVILAYRVSYVLRASRAFLDLWRSEEKTRALLRAIPDLIFRIGKDGTLLEVVSASETGHALLEEYRGKKLADVFPAEVAENAARCTNLALQTGEIQGFEYVLPSDKDARCYEARIVDIGEGESLYIARDITERKKAEKRIAFLAYHDSLTGLPNRVTLNERLSRDLARARRKEETIGVVMIDLDRFKEVNDTLGHNAGDRLLQEVAERLSSCIRETDTVARMSGDEFCVILPDQADEHTVTTAARRIHRAFASPFLLDGQEMNITASLGLSMFPSNGDTVETLVKNADIAMFRAKAQGKDALQVFSEEMSAAVAQRIETEKALRTASVRNEFVNYYQPEIDLRTGRIIGAEALIRWLRPGKGLIPPMQFIPVAEETGAILPISEWAIETACAQAKIWQSEGFSPFRMSVNVSGRLFQQYDLVRTITQVLGNTGLDPGSLEVEITESIAMKNLDSTLEVLWSLNRLSIRVAMDDFGTGYSSLAYLRKFPIQLLKIDRAFIKDLIRNPEDQAIVKAIIAMAHTLKIEVIAEGVETAEQLDFLKTHGCDKVQGFLFSKPVPAEEFVKLLAGNRQQAF